MADFVFNFTQGYDAAGDKSFLLGSSSGTDTLTDNDGGTTFETTDTNMDDVGGSRFGLPGATYQGSFVQQLDGVDVTFLVVQDNSGAGSQYVFANIPDTVSLDREQISDALPASLPTLTTTAFTVCFAAGTLISTPGGERKVETLAIGDLVMRPDGKAITVKWVGRQTLHKIFTPAERFVPVRICAGALGHGLPHSDLVLTAEHALIIDGLAINAGALVNGSSITFEPIERLPEQVTYFHIETDDHDVILANGAPAETYVDYVQRAAFDNYREYLDLYGEERTIAEMDRPRISAARMVPPALRARLNRLDAA